MPKSTRTRAGSNPKPASYEVFGVKGAKLPPAPPWRRFDPASKKDRGAQHVVGGKEKEAINAALCLRRPLLVTGRPGAGKSSLAWAIAEDLGFGPVLTWPITSRSTLQQGLYDYDAIARVQETARWQNVSKDDSEAKPALAIENFLTLGPLGTALADSTEEQPRVLLIDEIDKSDIDLPNDLLHVFEEGEFIIPELARAGQQQTGSVNVPLHGEPKTDKGRKAPIENGHVRCRAFPIVVLTSNGEREFPPAFLRRCLRLDIAKYTHEQLANIVRNRLKIDPEQQPQAKQALKLFEKLQDEEKRLVATDQLLNAIHLLCTGGAPYDEQQLRELILRALSDERT